MNTNKPSDVTDPQSSSSSPKRIKLHESTIGEEEIAAVADAMRVPGGITSGQLVREFERHFGANASFCNSGSSANLLAVAGAVASGRLRAGDEVIVPALSWSTSVWPLIQYGMVPVVVDIDPDTLNIDMDQIAEAITPKTRGIVAVHVYGNPCELDRLAAFRRMGLWVMEDCCESLGATWNRGRVGTVGDVATYSFYYSHHITTGEGGMVVPANDDIAEQTRILRCHGWVRDCQNPVPWTSIHKDIDPRFLFVGLGYNLRCTEMQAAMGLVQLRKLPDFVWRRRETAKRLDNALAKHDRLITQYRHDGASPFGYILIVRADAGLSAPDLRAYLELNGIETRSVICGNIARQPAMKRYEHRVPFDTPYADHVMTHGFSIGCHHAMTESDVFHIEKVIDEFMEAHD